MKQAQKKAQALGRRVVTGYFDGKGVRWDYAIIVKQGADEAILCASLEDVNAHLAVLARQSAA